MAQPQQAQQKPTENNAQLTKVVAVSLAPPGHWSGGHKWPSDRACYANLTPAQLVEVKGDRRLCKIDLEHIESCASVQEREMQKLREEEALAKTKLAVDSRK